METSLTGGSDIAGRRAGRLALVLVALSALPGVLRDVSVYFWKAGPLPAVRARDRFAGLSLPEKAGFFTDVAGGLGERRYYEALYALAPQVLLRGTSPRLLLADVEDPAAIDQLCARGKLRVVRRVSPGVALLERE